MSKFTGGVRDGLYNIDFPFLGKLLILNYFFSVSSALSKGVFVICVSVSFSLCPLQNAVMLLEEETCF